jgi:hypothetical protein
MLENKLLNQFKEIYEPFGFELYKTKDNQYYGKIDNNYIYIWNYQRKLFGITKISPESNFKLILMNLKDIIKGMHQIKKRKTLFLNNLHYNEDNSKMI